MLITLHCLSPAETTLLNISHLQDIFTWLTRRQIKSNLPQTELIILLPKLLLTDHSHHPFSLPLISPESQGLQIFVSKCLLPLLIYTLLVTALFQSIIIFDLD